MFNVGLVTTLEDGRVVSLEALSRRQENKAAKTASSTDLNGGVPLQLSASSNTLMQPAHEESSGVINLSRLALIQNSATKTGPRTRIRSKTQQRKLAALEPRSLH